ncbi:MAG: PhaM family polyhydroxyalkanoate granule multifunctional regulatory protein [Betaproteobacteria bacterium]
MTKPPDDTPASGAFPTPQQALEFMQKMWNPLGVPMPGFGLPGAATSPAAGGMPFPHPAMMFAAIDPAEVDRKIGELRVVENWLAMSLAMMQMSIRTLELQKASLEAMRSAAPAGGRGKGADR